jgi:hypothetical protein
MSDNFTSEHELIDFVGNSKDLRDNASMLEELQIMIEKMIRNPAGEDFYFMSHETVEQ